MNSKAGSYQAVCFFHPERARHARDSKDPARSRMLAYELFPSL